MKRRRAAWLSILLAAGCGARSTLGELGASSTEPRDAGDDAPVVPPSDAGPTDAATDGPVADPWAAKLTGYWIQQSIGDCINVEDWYAFSPPADLVHTQVNRNFCGPHDVETDPGAFSVDGRVVSIDWAAAQGHELRRFSAALIDPYPSPPPPAFPGYVTGTRALNMKAYVRDGETLVWHHESLRKTTQTSIPVSLYQTSVKIDVTLDAPLAPTGKPVACVMTVAFEAMVSPDSNGKPASGKELFKLPCTYGPAPGSTWQRLTANGFEESQVDGSWLEYLKAQGIYDKYASGLAGVFEQGFRPVLSFDPADTSAMFNDVSFAWLFEMKSPPPDQVN